MGDCYTIESYLKGLVGIEIPESTLRSILFKRGVDEGSSAGWLDERSMDLCSADVYLWCSLLPSSRGSVKDADNDWSHQDPSFALSVGDKRGLRAIARALYDKWGEEMPSSSKIVLRDFCVL